MRSHPRNGTPEIAIKLRESGMQTDGIFLNQKRNELAKQKLKLPPRKRKTN